MAHNFATLSPKEAIEWLLLVLTSKHTRRHRPLLHGDPGVGKSAILREVAQRMGARLIDLRLMQLEGPDLRGLTMIDVATGQTRHIRPEFLPEYTDQLGAEPIIIFLDEIMGAHDSIRKAAFEMILDHRVGPHKFGDNVYLVGAGNSAEDGTNVYELDAATADRFCHVRIEPTIEGFLEHGTKMKYHPAILAFIKNHPTHMMPTDADHRNGTIARPSPRSFERASETLYSEFPKQYRDVSLRGWLGDSAAGDLIVDLDDKANQYDLMKLINAKPSEREFPSSSFGIYALAQNLAAYAETPEKLDTAIDIMTSIPDSQTDTVEECKTSFFNIVDQKMRQWNLLFHYCKDERVVPFLDRTDEILKAADQAAAIKVAA